MIALLRERGVDVVMKRRHRREFDFSKGRRVGKGDLLVTWKRPQRPTWMDEETYQSLPEELTVRLLEVHVCVKGFRTQKYVVATTLTDPCEYPSESFGELYFQRWHAELDLRNIKCTMHLDSLACKTPEMVRKELWTHWLATTWSVAEWRRRRCPGRRRAWRAWADRGARRYGSDWGRKDRTCRPPPSSIAATRRCVI
jgi:hypothetical protein